MRVYKLSSMHFVGVESVKNYHQWLASETKAKQQRTKDKRQYNGRYVGEIEAIELPKGKPDMLAWLNKNVRS